MKSIIKKDKDLIKIIIIATAWFMFIAHGFCYLNIIFSHDSGNIFHGGYYGDSIGIGRYMIPVWNYIRGEYYPPLLIGSLSTIFFIVINYLIVKLFEFKDKKTIVLMCGMLTTFTSVTLLNATYLNYSDMYIFSLLLNVIAVWFFRKKNISLIACICLYLSFGIYQAYLGVTVGLLLILFIKDLLENKKIGNILKKGIICIIHIVLALVLYMGTVKVLPSFINIPLVDSYNSVSNLKFDNLNKMFKIFLDTYESFKKNLIISNTVHRTLVSYSSLIVVLLSICFLIKSMIIKKIGLKRSILLILIILLLPFGINIIYFITGGVYHGLMTYPIVITYVLVLYLINSKNKIIRYIYIICFTLIISSNIIFSNQVYEKKKLELDSTIMTLNRVINRIESLDGYEPAKTPIIIVGDLNYGPLKVKKDKFDYDQVGLIYFYSTTYPQSYYRFIYYYLGYPITLYENTDALRLNSEYRANKRVKKMGVFPAKDSVKMIDNKVVVKLS